MSDVVLTKSQQKAIKSIVEWFLYGTRDQQVFRMDMHGVCPSVLFAAFTGKAAYVMRKHGTPANTISSLAYKVCDVPEMVIEQEYKLLSEMKEKCVTLEGFEKRDMEIEIREKELQIKRLKKPHFELNQESAIRDCELLVLDECFPAGTMIDTPNGYRPIETVKSGDEISNAYGTDHVVSVFRKEIKSAVQITFGGKTITSSGSHRFFTKRGEVSASDLRPGDELVTVGASVRLLRQYFQTEKLDFEILQLKLREALVVTIPRSKREILHSGPCEEFRIGKETISEFRKSRSGTSDTKNQGIKSNIKKRGEGKNQQYTQEPWIETICSGRERQGINETSEVFVGYYGGELGTGNMYIDEIETPWISEFVQGGFGKPGYDDYHRSGREITPFFEGKRKGSKENRISEFSRVDSVEVLEPGDIRLDSIRDADGKLYFYDIQALRHHSFGVSGVLVHNCSMVDHIMGTDLLSFGKPILVLGDPGQLPPIRGEGFFINHKPDVMLTEIHRQAMESPIIRLGIMAREFKPIPFGRYDDNVWKMHKYDFEETDLLNADQVICGMNATRYQLNNSMRKTSGFDIHTPWPTSPREKIICLKNMHDKGLINGMFINVDDVEYVNSHRRDVRDVAFSANITTEDGLSVGYQNVYNGHFMNHVSFDPERLQNDWKISRRMVEATFGWAITCHKAQGSQWKNVIVIDDGWGRLREERAKWLYTSLSRAEEGLCILA
jgi:intein/homing endonuclease